MLQTVGEGGFATGGLRVVQEAVQLFPAQHVVKPTVMMRREMSSSCARSRVQASERLQTSGRHHMP